MLVSRIPPVELFFSYSREDAQLRDELERHLAILKRAGTISAWHDRQIGAGLDWAGQIDRHLERAAIILLLVSADFLASDYCYDVELQCAMARHARGEARVIPVLLRAVDWEGAPFSALQAVPTSGRPVTSWPNRDEAFLDVVRAIRAAAADLAATPARSTTESLAKRKSYYPVVQRQLIAESTTAFVGRRDVTAAFARFRSRNPRGYFVVEGVPGQGKTALAARLVSDQHLVHHFAGRNGGRAESRLILCSLLEQLGASPSEKTAAGPVEELAATYEEALLSRSSETAALTIVIDALDELALEVSENPPFLPTDGLPPHVYFLVTSQPGDRLERWKDRLAEVPYEVCTLAPLSDVEVREIIRQRVPGTSDGVASSIVDVARGTPLYVRAALDSVERDPDFDPAALPDAVEGYFRRSMRNAQQEGLLRDVLGLLAVSREAMSLRDLADITATSQRRVHDEGILPVRHFLVQSGYEFAFYHQRLHDFVVNHLLYSDELTRYHKAIADWLERSIPDRPYYWSSFAHHLFYADQRQRLLDSVDRAFLAEKLKRMGYAVLEDIELIARARLEAGDPAVVQRCAALVEGLRPLLGTDLIDDVAKRVQPNWTRAVSRRALEPMLQGIPGVDVHAALIPKGHVTADFIEVVPARDRLIVAIGDAPSSGLKSAFVARFIASAFRRLVENARPLHLGRTLTSLHELIASNEYFERVSMQCVEIAPSDGVAAIASAGHPYPLLYSARRGTSDRLPVRGPRLHELIKDDRQTVEYEQRHFEMGQGDVLVLVSDGVTEPGRLDEDAYGYRFSATVERHANDGARAICRAIVEDWRRHPRGVQYLDDTAVLVVVMTGAPVASSAHAL